MSILGNNSFSKFGFLDTEAVQDGEALDTFRLNVIARNHNTLLDERECLFNVPFYGNEGDPNDCSWIQYTSLNGWRPIMWPIPFFKRPDLRRMEVFMRAESELIRVQVQCVTYGSPFRPNAQSGDDGVLSFSSVSVTESVSTEVALRGTSVEALFLFARASVKNEPGDSGTYGRNGDSIGSGTDFVVYPGGLTWAPNGSTPGDIWITGWDSPNNYSRGHFITFAFGSATSDVLTTPRRITAMTKSYDQSAFFCHFTPELSPEEVAQLNEGGAWEIHSSNSIRLVSVGGYSTRRL